MKKLLLLLLLIPNLVMADKQVPCSEFSPKGKLYKLEKQEDGNLVGRADFNDDGIIDSYTIQSGEAYSRHVCGSGGCNAFVCLDSNSDCEKGNNRSHEKYFQGNHNAINLERTEGPGLEEGYFYLGDMKKDNIRTLFNAFKNGEAKCWIGSFDKDKKEHLPEHKFFQY